MIKIRRCRQLKIRNGKPSNSLVAWFLTRRRGLKALALYKTTSPLEGTTCEQRAEVKRARLMRTGQEEVCFQCEDMSIRKQGEGLIPRKIISCHSEDEIRRISISWKTNANPCDSSLRSERQVLCHTALDAVSHKYSAFTSSPCDRGSEFAMTIPILPLAGGAMHVENLQAGKAGVKNA